MQVPRRGLGIAYQVPLKPIGATQPFCHTGAQVFIAFQANGAHAVITGIECQRDIPLEERCGDHSLSNPNTSLKCSLSSSIKFSRERQSVKCCIPMDNTSVAFL